ncbi:MAG TPA: type I-E CRISPR-associated protein Cas7/Cse4/CasC [Acidobacteriaceae bacterium]|nr:type I-E CRISPR-associated protein Cas7/Cse4/CasC [Acidobacteriaceae bacterium]
MSRFIQLHVLTSYPPANLNRDDLGQPKTARVGGVERLRISSQSLKRAWRKSDVFAAALAGKIGTRTKRLGVEAFEALKKAGVAEKKAEDWAKKIAAVFGAAKKASPLEIEQLVHVSPEERKAVGDLVARLAEEDRAPKDEELGALLSKQTAADIAMFGRMLADKPQHNVEAAVQVAHAIGVHASPIEDDYFTAVDDLNRDDESGAGHVGEAGFGAALFYEYVCIDREHLKENLGGDEGLTERALRALIEVVLKVAPTGKQNSFASRAYAHFALAEKGDQQPRSLALAFLKPVGGADYASEATDALLRLRENMEMVYGQCADACVQMNVMTGEGSAAALADFVAGD